MRRTIAPTRLRWAIAPVAAGLLLLGAPARSAPTEKPGANVDGQALKIVARMSDYLARAQQFSVVIDMSYDVVQEWGQKLEFGETRTVAVRRPDRLRMDTTDRDGSSGGLVFDGKEITAFDGTDKAYATAAKAGTIDDAVSYFANDLGMRLPMGGALSSRLPEIIEGWANTARDIGPATIAGVPCDHVAFSGDWEDVQMWIARGDKPLLQRMVITYTRAEGKPQFAAQLRDWNLSPDTNDSRFVFAPPEGFVKIEFAPLAGRQQPAVPGEKGGQP